MGAPTPVPAGHGGLQPETDWGADVPLPGPPPHGETEAHGGPLPPGQVPAQSGVWVRGWTPGGLLIRRDSCQSHRVPLTERQDLPAGGGTGRQALRLSPPPAGNPHSEARGQAWTGAASLRPPWDRAEPGPGPSLEAAAQTPPGCWERGRRDRDEQRQIAGERQTPGVTAGQTQRDTQRGRATLSTECTLGAAPETRVGGGLARGAWSRPCSDWPGLPAVGARN